MDAEVHLKVKHRKAILQSLGSLSRLLLESTPHLSCAPNPHYSPRVKKHTQLHHAGIVIGRANRQGYNQRDGMGNTRVLTLLVMKCGRKNAVSLVCLDLVC